MHKWGWTRCQRGRWKWGTPLFTDASRMSKDAAVLTEDQDALTTEKEYPDPHRTQRGKGKEG